MKDRKGKKRNVSRVMKIRELDRQIKGGRNRVFVIGVSSGEAWQPRGIPTGTATKVMRGLGVGVNDNLGRKQDFGNV